MRRTFVCVLLGACAGPSGPVLVYDGPIDRPGRRHVVTESSIIVSDVAVHEVDFDGNDIGALSLHPAELLALDEGWVAWADIDAAQGITTLGRRSPAGVVEEIEYARGSESGYLASLVPVSDGILVFDTRDHTYALWQSGPLVPITLPVAFRAFASEGDWLYGVESVDDGANITRLHLGDAASELVAAYPTVFSMGAWWPDPVVAGNRLVYARQENSDAMMLETDLATLATRELGKVETPVGAIAVSDDLIFAGAHRYDGHWERVLPLSDQDLTGIDVRRDVVFWSAISHEGSRNLIYRADARGDQLPDATSTTDERPPFL